MHGEIRRSFPSLLRDLRGSERIYLNSAGGTLTAERSVRALARAAQYANAQDGEVTSGERLTTELHARARSDTAAFLNAPSPEEISFHLSTTHSLFNLAFAFRDLLRRGDNLIVTQLDHAANVTPWESLWEEDRGVEVRQCRLRQDGTLDLDHLARLVNRRTRLVAVTLASNGLGSIVPMDSVVRIARRYGRPRPPRGRRRLWEGALTVVDAVHHAFHGPIDVQRLECDFLTFSGYKLFGPMVGALWGRREWLEALRPYRVEPNPDRPPVKFEQGTPSYTVLAGLRGALEYLQWLGESAERAAAQHPRARSLREWLRRSYPLGERRRLKWAMIAIREYEKTLTAAALEGFRQLEPLGVRLHGIAEASRLSEREPTLLFEVQGQRPEAVKRRLWEDARIEVPNGHNYSVAVYRSLKLDRALRVSFAHYDTPDTVRHFLESLRRIAGG
ncbi:MAG: aminotransferase class V-fold PLP-dependent enzyme [Acidobacteriota bacterium]